ncbi:MAG: transposase [Ferruginibacter sp.]
MIESTTILLFSEILRGVGRNPINEAKKKGGIKVHTMIDAFGGLAEFVPMTKARTHDRKFLAHIELPTNSFVAFDKAYDVYNQFAKWTAQKVWFAARMKDSAVFHVIKVMMDHTKKKNAKVVLKEQYITIGYKNTNGYTLRVQLRRITFKADDGKVYCSLQTILSFQRPK